MTTTTTNNVSKFTSKEQVLAALASGQCTVDAASAWLKAHESNGNGTRFSLKVSEKGALSIRGIRGISAKFGLTIYAEGFEDLFAHREEIEKFIKEHAGKLSRKSRGND